MSNGFYSKIFLESVPKMLSNKSFKDGLIDYLEEDVDGILKKSRSGESLDEVEKSKLVEAASEVFLENSRSVISFGWDGDAPFNSGQISIRRITDIYMLVSSDMEPEGPFSSINEALHTEYFDFSSTMLTYIESESMPATMLVDIAKGLFDWKQGKEILINSEKYVPVGNDSYPAKRKLIKAKDLSHSCTEIVPTLLEIKKFEDSLALYYLDHPIKFKNGKVAKHNLRSFWEHIIEEFTAFGSLEVDMETMVLRPPSICSYALLEHQKCEIEQPNCQFINKFRDAIAFDEIIRPCAGPEVVDQIARYESVFSFLNDLGISLPNHPQVTLESYDASSVFTDPDEMKFVEGLEKAFLGFSVVEKTVVHFLFSGHNHALLFPMVLAKRRCTAAGYANGVMAAECVVRGVFGDVGVDEHRNYVELLKNDATVALEFLSASIDPFVVEIEGGETEIREFKSTLQKNLHTGKKDKNIAHASLKTVAAFLNSIGGDLFIGVDDSGTVLGIEEDGFPNNDRFLLCLTDLVNDQIGKEFRDCWNAELREIDGKTVCKVVVRRSGRAVFLGKEEELFIRTGPSTNKLNPKQAIEYVANHFE